jgi:hypothetical protein
VYLKFFIKLKNKNGYSWGTKAITAKRSRLKKIFNISKDFNYRMYFVLGFHFNVKKHFSILKNNFNQFAIVQRIQFTVPGQIIYTNYLKEFFMLSIIQSNCV